MGFMQGRSEGIQGTSVTAATLEVVAFTNIVTICRADGEKQPGYLNSNGFPSLIPSHRDKAQQAPIEAYSSTEMSSRTLTISSNSPQYLCAHQARQSSELPLDKNLQQRIKLEVRPAKVSLGYVLMYTN